MKTSFTFSSILMLLGCTPMANQPSRAPAVSTLMALSGSEGSIASFEASVRRCGLTTERMPADWGPLVVRVIGPTFLIGDDDGRYACVDRWLADHPGQLGFAGNEAQ